MVETMVGKKLLDTAGDVGKAARKAIQGERLVENVANEGIDIYTLNSAKRLLGHDMMKGNIERLDGGNPEGLDQPDLEEGSENEIFSEQELESKRRGECEEYLAEKREEYLNETRNPSKLSADIAKRVSEKHRIYDAARWAQTDAAGRREMLKEIYRDMAEEACLPNSLIEGSKIDIGNLGEKGTAKTSLFIEPDEMTGKIEAVGQPEILFEASKIADPEYDFADAVEVLYRETLQVVQQHCLTESSATFAMAGQGMERGIERRLDAGILKSSMEYLKDSMFNYAQGHAHVFAGLFNRWQEENL